MFEELAGRRTTETDSRSQRSRASRWGGQVLTRPHRSRSRAACPGRFLSDAPHPTHRPYESQHPARTVPHVIPDTNAIESLNARYRRAVKARGHFPSEQAALKCLYLVTRSLDPTGRGRQRWAQRWKPALNAFSITFADRFPAAETY
ncbi:MAG: transposase [Ilumatobacteraceae bacterium]